MAVANELPRLRPRRGQPEPVDDVVEAAFEQLQQRLAGDPARPVRHLEIAAELVLQHAVDSLDLLLLAQLQTVAHELRLPQLAVLSRRQVALLNRALLRIAALPLQEELHAFAPAQPADRTDVTCHSLLFLLATSFQLSASGQNLPASARLQLEAGSWKPGALTPAAASAAGSRCAGSASRRESTSRRCRSSAGPGSPTRALRPVL